MSLCITVQGSGWETCVATLIHLHLNALPLYTMSIRLSRKINKKKRLQNVAVRVASARERGDVPGIGIMLREGPFRIAEGEAPSALK